MNHRLESARAPGRSRARCSMRTAES